MAVRKLPKDVLKMASGLISPSGLAGHRRPLCIVSFPDRDAHQVVSKQRAEAEEDEHQNSKLF